MNMELSLDYSICIELISIIDGWLIYELKINTFFIIRNEELLMHI